MHVPTIVLIQRHRLQQDVVRCHLRCVVTKIGDLVNSWSDFEGVWVHGLADLTLESLPVE